MFFQRAAKYAATLPPLPLSYYDADFAVRPFIGVATWPGGLHDATANKTWLAWESSLQTCAVTIAEYDHAGDSWSFEVVDTHDLIDDDHSPPALELLSDGRLVCFYGSHGSDLRWSISDQSGGEPDITNWTRQTAVSGDYTYPKPVNIDTGGGGGDLYLYMRRTDASNLPFIVKKATYTSGGGVSFGADTVLVDFNGGSGARVYVSEVRAQGSNIEFMAARADYGDSTRDDVYYFRHVLSTGAVENLGGGTSVSSGALPVDLTTANASYREFTTTEGDVPTWCRDTSGDLHVLFLDDSGSPYDFKHAIYSGGSWSTPVVVDSVIDQSPGNGYKAGIACLPGAAGKVEAWFPAGDNGAFTSDGGDDMMRRVYNGSWGAAETIVTGDEVTALGRPVPIKDAHSDFRVAFGELSQSVTETNRSRLKRYGYGDGGFVQWPTFNDPNLHSVILNLQMEGADGATTQTDLSHWSHLHGVTFNGNAQIDTAQKPSFATSSLRLDGTGDYLIVDYAQDFTSPGHEYKFNPGTLEMFVRPNESGRAQMLASTRGGAPARGFGLFLTTTNKIQFIVYDDASSVVANITGATTLSVGTWYRVAVVRDGNDVYIYVDTTQDASGVFSGAPSDGDTLCVGRDRSNTARDFNGWISAVRWTKDVARSMASVPTAHYPTD